MELKDFLKENIRGINLVELLEICARDDRDYFDGILISSNLNELCDDMTAEEIIVACYGNDVDIYEDYFQLSNNGKQLKSLNKKQAIEIAEENADMIIEFYIDNREEYMSGTYDLAEELIEVYADERN